MPSLYGLTVSIVDENLHPLEEYGTRRLHRASTASCYIQSKTDMIFRVKVEPELPYPKETAEVRVRQNPSDWARLARESERRSGTDRHHSDQRHRSRAKRRAGRYPRDEHDWHFIASVYLDGRREPERSCIVYLDPNNPDFRHERNGVSYLSHRWVQQKDGRIMQHSWVFKEVGIESLLDKLLIGGDISADDAIATKDEEELLVALGDTGIHDKEETKQLGQITVQLRRVNVTASYATRDFRPKFSEGQKEDVNMTDVDGVSHTSQ